MSDLLPIWTPARLRALADAVAADHPLWAADLRREAANRESPTPEEQHSPVEREGE